MVRIEGKLTALDTNIWIYLTKDPFFELWNRFKAMKENGEIRVIINDIIFKEWKRNKVTTIKSLVIDADFYIVAEEIGK